MDFGWELFNVDAVANIGNVGVKDGVELLEKEREEGKIDDILNFLSKIIWTVRMIQRFQTKVYIFVRT